MVATESNATSLLGSQQKVLLLTQSYFVLVKLLQLGALKADFTPVSSLLCRYERCLQVRN